LRNNGVRKAGGENSQVKKGSTGERARGEEKKSSIKEGIKSLNRASTRGREKKGRGKGNPRIGKGEKKEKEYLMSLISI